jgi:hypothetical protein
MSLSTPTTPSIEERLARLESIRTTFAPPAPPIAEHAKIPTWLGVVNAGTLLAVIIAIGSFGYYLGGINSTLSTTSANVEKLNNAVSGTSRESITNRLSVIETKIDSINKSPQRSVK